MIAYYNEHDPFAAAWLAPGTFPLAPAGTVRNRVGLLRGAGNAICLAQAQGFIEAVMELRQPQRLAA